MKKIILSAVILATMAAACGGGGEEQKSETSASDTKTEAPASDNSSNPDYQKGLALVGQYQCITCHKIDEKLTGPAYRDVAKKYAGADDATITKLAQKVITGGSGVWGDIPMTPHPNVSEADAKAMVKYILLLNK
ncbi:cytochrome c class I [Niabella ginsenosidivorans]|uniref:Cytochrome c class I n=1 Tax=Niabella ginsenosidivorans TaxID=1176587 RepID=A0A1A9I2X6_9BACT|nr:c-type cytochrome [Niabella ginsenosidivorans]ANH81032.1 cytochrome c class I [Niabella ginsenosidivorans]